MTHWSISGQKCRGLWSHSLTDTDIHGYYLPLLNQFFQASKFSPGRKYVNGGEVYVFSACVWYRQKEIGERNWQAIISQRQPENREPCTALWQKIPEIVANVHVSRCVTRPEGFVIVEDQTLESFLAVCAKYEQYTFEFTKRRNKWSSAVCQPSCDRKTRTLSWITSCTQTRQLVNLHTLQHKKLLCLRQSRPIELKYFNSPGMSLFCRSCKRNSRLHWEKILQAPPDAERWCARRKLGKNWTKKGQRVFCPWQSKKDTYIKICVGSLDEDPEIRSTKLNP